MRSIPPPPAAPLPKSHGEPWGSDVGMSGVKVLNEGINEWGTIRGRTIRKLILTLFWVTFPILIPSWGDL